MTYTPDRSITAKLGDVTRLLSGARDIDREFAEAPAKLAVLPGGALYLDSDLQLDTDGWVAPPGKTDPTHDSKTSLCYERKPEETKAAPIDANRVCYFVLPKPPSQMHALGITIGDYGVMLHKGRLIYAVFADFGPDDKIGEASIATLRAFGKDRLGPDGDIVNAPLGSNAVTIVFPGSGRGNGHFADEASLVADIEAVARTRFVALGGNPDA